MRQLKPIGKRYNRIWLFAGMLIYLTIGMFGVRGAFAASLAMEQTAQCGLEEHIHDTACYDAKGLACTQTVHAHTENCYLVRLSDNDINGLLTQVDEQESNSLQQLIDDTVSQASGYVVRSSTQDAEQPEDTGQTEDTEQPEDTGQSEDTGQTEEADSVQAVLLGNQPESTGQEQTGTEDNSVQTEQTEQAKLDVAALNTAIVENDIQPAIVLNENLYKSTTSESTALLTQQAIESTAGSSTQISQPAAIPLSTGTDSGVSTLAVGDQESTSDNKVNVYAYLDNSWVCIGTLDFEVQRASFRYTARLQTSAITNLIQTSLGVTYVDSRMNLVYSTTADFDDAVATGTSGSYTTMGTNYGQRSTARRVKYLYLVDSSNDPLPFYTVTYTDLNGVETKEYALSGDTVTLPSGSQWTDGKTTYGPGQSVEILGPTDFTAFFDTGAIYVSYDVDFPTVGGVTVATKPTLYGTTSTTLSDTVEEESQTVIRNVSQHEVQGRLSDGNSRIIRFSGWRVGDSDTILRPNSTLSWAEMQSLASAGRIELTGVWETEALQTASFYVRYDSKPIDTEGGGVVGGAVTDYTPELFATHVGGTDVTSLSVNALNEKYYIADTTTDNSFGADQRIRSLYGEQPGIWLQSFPDDEYIFEKLRTYAENRQLEVDGEPVDPDDLHAEAYAIRWYVFKAQSDAWHIDGRLVKKQGLVFVKKSFAGNRIGVDLAKEDFSITAANGAGTKSHTLTLNNYLSYDAATDTYTWQVDGMDYAEPWTVTEHTYQRSNDTGGVTYLGYSEYSVVDAQNRQNKTGAGTAVDIIGETYALDAGTDQVLRVEFTNVYHTVDSIIIKKEDARTGNPLAGAIFRLLQNDQPLTFSYNAATNQYIFDAGGDITELTGSTTGYYELIITGFSYDNGNVTVQELQAPSGYTPIENITIGYVTDPDTGQPAEDVAILSTSPLASYYDGLLIIENSTEDTSVTVTKQWLCPEADWADVTVQLLANGQMVSSLIPGVEPSMLLTQANGYRATWTGLPAYANGSPITWSVREVRIGTEQCKSDFTFANWLVSYSDPTYTRDGSGRVTNTAFTIQNDTRRTLLRVYKTNLSGSVRLPGAVFTLEYLISDGHGGYVTDTSFTKRTQTTGSDGTLTFDNLLYGYYRLQETSPPDGYEQLIDPVYLTIREDGTVVVDSHTYAQAGSAAYSVLVRNMPKRPLPATGGGGPGPFVTMGTLLMLGAVCGYLLPRIKKKGRYRSG